MVPVAALVLLLDQLTKWWAMERLSDDRVIDVFWTLQFNLVRNPGEGSPPSLGAQLVVHYEGYLLDGRKFDSSLDRKEPLVFRVGTGDVIKGWDEAFLTMKKGEKRTLLIPWWLGYGEKGRGMIPPRGTLRFEVELVEIRPGAVEQGR